jgi:hypothetical protein
MVPLEIIPPRSKPKNRTTLFAFNVEHPNQDRSENFSSTRIHGPVHGSLVTTQVQI